MEKKIALVTGSLKGLGLETAKQLFKKGYQVIITGRDSARGEKIKSELSQMDIKVDFIFLDVSKPDSIDHFVKDVLKEFKRVDVLVNNAGIFLDGKESEAVQQSFTTNSLGPYLLTRALLPAMLKNNFGRVVNVSSGMGQLSEMESGYPAYRISKTALNAVTKIFSSEADGKGILVNSVCPGWVKTDMGGNGAERTVEVGASGIVWAATLPEGGPNGGFFRDGERIEW